MLLCRQGDEERAFELPVSPLCDRHNCKPLPVSQLGPFNHNPSAMRPSQTTVLLPFPRVALLTPRRLWVYLCYVPGFFGFVAQPLFRGVRSIFAEALAPHQARMEANQREWEQLAADADAQRSGSGADGFSGAMEAGVGRPLSRAGVCVTVDLADT